MVLFIVLGLVVLMALTVLGVLFFMLGKEGRKEEEKAVPLTNLDQLKKEFSPLLSQPKVAVKQPAIIPPLEAKITMPTQEVKISLEEGTYKKRAEELEVELKAISIKAGTQLHEANLMIDTLTEENESLKRQKVRLEEAEKNLSELETNTEGLKSDNAHLQSQLEATNTKMRLLEDEMAAVKVQMGQEIARANATVAELQQEKENLLSMPKPDPDAALKQELEGFKSQQQQLQQKYEDLQKELQKLRDLNTHLMEKNDLFQYEMVKARAQSSGLERVSFNYKNQLEDFFKKINAVQVTNEHLSNVKNRLEGDLEEIKLQNEELLKKDQLSQFELEKNRSRVVILERECEELKSRVQQKDMP